MPFHSFRGQRSGKPAKDSGGYSQAKHRHDIFSYDQDGRKWWAPAENVTGMPCGLIQPTFSAPYMPDSQYVIVNPDNTSECYVDWSAIKRDRINAMKEYHRRAVAKADKNGWPTPKLGEYNDEILAAEGNPPRAFQLALAAEQGNPWVLGLFWSPRARTWGPQDELHRIPAPVDARLVKYLELPSLETESEIDTIDYSAASYAAIVDGAESGESQRAPFTSRRAPTADSSAVHAHDGQSLEEIQEAMLAREVAENMDATGEIDSLATEPDTEIDLEEEDEPEVASGAEEIDVDEMLESAVDAEALGGRTIAPQNMDRARRQAPLRGAKTAKSTKRGARASEAGAPVETTRRAPRAWNPGSRASLADGAKPVIGE